MYTHYMYEPQLKHDLSHIEHDESGAATHDTQPRSFKNDNRECWVKTKKAFSQKRGCLYNTQKQCILQVFSRF